MSLAQKVKIELDDGREIETSYDSRDMREWESMSRKSWLVEDTSLSMIAWASHHAAVRRGELDGELKDFKAFNAVCVGVQYLRDEEPPDPTQAEPTKDSPTSPGDDSSSP